MRKKRLSTALLAVFGLSVSAIHAEERASPPPFKDFSARWVKPPKPGERPNLVQITPEDTAVSTEPGQTAHNTEGAVATSSTRFDWFWDAVSPELTASGPGRLDQALRAIARAKSPVPAPRLQSLQDMARAHGVDILRATVGTEVSPALVLAVMTVESAGRADAVSSAGAQGLMQLMPATAERFGVTDSLQPTQNIVGGVKYLDWLMGHFERDPVLVLAGYNAGEGAVRDHAGVPPYSETRDYVPKVLAAYQVARGLCLTPPELITDGCVFAGMN